MTSHLHNSYKPYKNGFRGRKLPLAALALVLFFCSSLGFAQSIQFLRLPSGDYSIRGRGFTGSQSNYPVEIYINAFLISRLQTENGGFIYQAPYQRFRTGDVLLAKVKDFNDDGDFERSQTVEPDGQRPPTPPRPPIPPRPPVPPTPPTPLPPPMPLPEPAPEQSCQVRVNVSSLDQQLVNVGVACTMIDRDSYLVVIDRSTSNLICREHFRSTSINSNVCTFRRNPGAMIRYEFELQSGGRTFRDTGVLFKDPSWNFAPEGHYNTPLDQTPPVRNQGGEKRRWDATIAVAVTDRDVDTNEGQNHITVQLVNADTGRVVATEETNSPGVVSFALYREFTKPWIGEAHFVGNLTAGDNHFLVRVLDAYQNGPVAAPLVLPVTTIHIVE